MPSAASILARVRSFGANVVLEDDVLRIINGRKLPANAATYVTQHRDVLVPYLANEEVEFDERAAVIEFDGKTPREWARQFADILIRRRPHGITDEDWSYFISHCGRIIDAGSEGTAA